MNFLGQLAGWLLFSAGVLAVLVSRFHSFFPFESDEQMVAFEAYRPYMFGAGLLAAIIGAAILRVSGVEFDLFESGQST